MFFETINTLINHHNFKSANIKVASDENGLFAVINLIADPAKVKDERVQEACSNPIIVRDTGDGFNLSLETAIEQAYQGFVDIDAFNASKVVEATKKASEVAKKSSYSNKTATVKPKPKAKVPESVSAENLFDDINEL